MSQPQQYNQDRIFYPEDSSTESFQQPDWPFEDINGDEELIEREDISFETIPDSQDESDVRTTEFSRTESVGGESTAQTSADAAVFGAELIEQNTSEIGEVEKAANFSKYAAIAMTLLALVGIWGVIEGTLSPVPTVAIILLSIFGAVFATVFSHQLG
jgi:hypothetical protein